ncbi:MAG: FHA domain-containing protein [Verrucomicrobiae bacterium]|nr:FHA domain-containing protein [Verrucomicrobiae bacterium]
MIRMEVCEPRELATSHSVARFPCVVGRDDSCDLRIEAAGVWGRHAEIKLDPSSGFHVAATGQGSVILNGESVTTARIRNGDRLDLGGLVLRFWLAPVHARSHRTGELVFWGLCLATLAGMIGLLLAQPR